MKALNPANTESYTDIYEKHALSFCETIKRLVGQSIDVRKLLHETYLLLITGKRVMYLYFFF